MIPITPEFYKADNILTLEELKKKVSEHRAEGKKIGMGSGSFDLMHPGHIAHLKSAKKNCDVFIALVAPDDHNVKKTQTRGRPIFSEQARAFSVSQLSSVDYVLLSGGCDHQIIKEIQPDIYIKGRDYMNSTNPDIEKSKFELAKYGATMHLTDDEKLSTTDIIKYIKDSVD